jgi:diamine N-acetyltransferase
MIKIVDASLADISVIRQLAERTWWHTYSQLLSNEQLTYMLEKIYSEESLRQVIETGSQNFIVITDNDRPVGFASYGLRPEEPTVCKLHKLYVLPETHGKGLGKRLLEEVKSRMFQSGIKLLDLNVKRDNPAKGFYEKSGFSILREEDIPFGPYLLQDYVMRISL